jgi:signal transduction histidine kinase
LGLSFVDGRLIPYLTTVMVLGMAASFLLGNLGDASRAWVGLGIVIGGAAIIVYKPAHSSSELIFIPRLFGIGWLGGSALRERSEQAEAADVHTAQAERERDAVARIAVAEERARIARELHDIVAHAVSVMVPQVGAVSDN